MLIRNYGLFWKRRDVFFGKPGHRGHLAGVPAKNISAEPVCFRDQQGVYALYDDNFRMIYVGQAGANDKQRLFDRLKQHERDQLADRWTKFSWFGIRPVNVTGELRAEKQVATPKIGDILNHIEAILIAAAEPPNNRQSGRFGDDVQQYLQHRDRDALGPTQDEMLKLLFKNMPSKLS